MCHMIARNGIVAGVLGATAVALCFLGVDMIYSHPFATPPALGRGLLGILGPRGTEGTAVFALPMTEWMNSPALRIYGGTSEIMRELISRNL